MPPRRRALALAMHHARQGKAAGGSVMPNPPWFVRNEARRMERSGGLPSAVPGRTDRLSINARSGAYVLPADVVSGIGQGNTLAGTAKLDSMFKTGPFGMKAPKITRGRGLPRPPRPAQFARGGEVGGEVPIMAAGGEYIIEPDQIMAQFGDIGFGHKVLDKFVKDIRQQTIQEMKQLPGPQR